MEPPTGRIALAHDYLTQRGGAERVVAIMARAFPDAPLYTTLYQRTGTFPEFSRVPLRLSPLNRVEVLRRHHRLAFPLLAPTVSRLTIDADLVIASSSGWAHGFATRGRKVVYCHAPARWLYQRDAYLGAPGGSLSDRGRWLLASACLGMMSPALRAWDRRQAATADRYLANSSVIAQAVREAYGIDAEVLAPPPAMLPIGPSEPIAGIDGAFVLCVARLLPYKHVDAVIQAVARQPGLGLVVVGKGPDQARLAQLAADHPDIHLLQGISDAALRWLYTQCVGLVAASYEDFGLTPLEAAAFGKPTVALHAGGYLDTIDAAVNGVFIEAPTPADIAAGIEALTRRTWDPVAIAAHAERFGQDRFIDRLRHIAAEELGR